MIKWPLYVDVVQKTFVYIHNTDKHINSYHKQYLLDERLYIQYSKKKTCTITKIMQTKWTKSHEINWMPRLNIGWSTIIVSFICYQYTSANCHFDNFNFSMTVADFWDMPHFVYRLTDRSNSFLNIHSKLFWKWYDFSGLLPNFFCDQVLSVISLFYIHSIYKLFRNWNVSWVH